MGQHRAIRKIKRLSVVFSDGKEEHRGTTSDFSFSGLFIRTRKPFPTGTELKIVLEIDENIKIELTGVVARSIKTRVVDFKNGMGVKLNPPTSREYRDFLGELLQEKF
jgi:Tfp pilus assembly protein PilZ